jgi:hypothetical protein
VVPPNAPEFHHSVIPVSAMGSQSSLSQRLSNCNLCATIFLCAILSYTTHDPNPENFSDWFPFHQNLFFLSIVCMVDFVLSPKFFMVTNYSSLVECPCVAMAYQITFLTTCQHNLCEHLFVKYSKHFKISDCLKCNAIKTIIQCRINININNCL